MATYTSVEAVMAELPARLPTDLSREDVEALIWQWSRYADGYVANAYAVPLPPYPATPGPVALAVRMLVVHDLHVRYGLFRGEPNRTHTLWAQAHEILRAIQKGEIVLTPGHLGGEGEPETEGTGVGTVPPLVVRTYRGRMSWEAQARRFGRIYRDEEVDG